MAFIAPGILGSGLTATAGFAALGWSSIPTVRDMGLFNAAGVFVVLLLTLTFVPAALVFLRPNAMGRAIGDHNGWSRGLNKLLHQLTAVVLFKTRLIWFGVIVITVVSCLGLLGLQVDTDYLRVFPRSSDTVQSAEKLHERLSGAAVVQVVLRGPPGAMFEPRFQRDLKELKQFALAQPGVDFAISVADIVERVAGPLYGQTEPAIPDSREKIESVFRDFLAGEESLARIAVEDSQNGSRALLVLRTHLFSSNELRTLTSRIDEWARGHLGPGLSARTTGPTVLLTNASDALARSQGHSLGLALATVYIMMAVLFRSFLLALVALIPNLLPIAGYFGFLGWSGIPLDITTSLVASAALGLAVDNAVQMVRRYQQSAARMQDEGWVMWLTMIGSGKPLVLANATLMAAFLIFTLSSFVPVRTGGLLWAITIGGCLVADLLVLPAMLKHRRLVRSGLRARVVIGAGSR
jgi:predicted RND superfamily exporter protein